MDCLLIAKTLTWTSPEWWWAIAQVCIGLGFVIFVHELGHFLVAKANGVKCEKFYVGFDFFDIKIGDLVLIPRSLMKFQWGETEYGVGIVPLGGYVKMLGQDDNPGNMEQELERSKAHPDLDDEQIERLGVLDRDKMDPRSFLAKSVIQRMAIISAGVIFNLITAVLFAAVAFKSGVNYNPAIIGDVNPGSPAWEENLYGASVTKLGDSNRDGYFPFVDLAQEVALSGETKPIEIEFTTPGSDEIQSTSVTPKRGLHKELDLALIGVERATVPKVTSDDNMLIEGNPAATANPPFQKDDLIVEINGEKVADSFDLKRILAKLHDQPLTFVVERKVSKDSEEIEKVNIQVGANPLRTSGLVMKWGPVTAVQSNSPAKGIVQPGDQVIRLNGADIGDLFTLEQRMTRIAQGKTSVDSDAASSASGTVTLTVLRDGKELELEITPRVPSNFANFYANRPVAVNSLGIAIESTKIVETSNVDGIEPGDEITSVEFLLPDDRQKEIYDKRFRNNPIELKEAEIAWVEIRTVVATLPEGFNFRLTANRNGEKVEADGVTTVSKGNFLEKRGILLPLLEKEYRSPTWSDAIQLGAVQTYKDGTRVFKFLGKLVGGKISPKNLGGPGTIAAVATSEATQGTSRLLLFMTLLSANLAIVNFLPIPVLDGGHMLFLAYEGLFRQPPNERVQIILTYAGLFMILGLMLYVILLDIQRFSGWF